MILYADATALATLHADEPGRGIVERALSEAGLVVTSAITQVELRRALQLAEEYGHLTHEQHREALMALERDWRGLVVLDLTANIASVAERIVEESTRLSITRATHLASALATEAAFERVYVAALGRDFGGDEVEKPGIAEIGASSITPLRVTFLTCDATLYSPARNKGLTVIYGS